MNLPISLDESNAGLVPPAVATVLMGAGGGFLLVFQVSDSNHTFLVLLLITLARVVRVYS